MAPARPAPSWPRQDPNSAKLTFAAEEENPELEAVADLLSRSVSPASRDADGVWHRVEARWFFVRQSRAVQAETQSFLSDFTARTQRRCIAEVLEVSGPPPTGAVFEADDLAAREKRGEVRRKGVAVSFDGAAARIEAVTASAYVGGTEGCTGDTGMQKNVVVAEAVRQSRHATSASVTGPLGAVLVVGGDEERTIAVRVRAWK